MAKGVAVRLEYVPRACAVVVHEGMETHRWGAVVAHRRFGKTVLAINHLQLACLECRRERPRFGFIAPFREQAKAIAWDYLVHYSRAVPGIDVRVSELSVTYPNGGQVRLFGADNPDALRGLYFDGVVLDEYGLMPAQVFTEVLRPALSDRGGWALFLGTPAGKNQFYRLIYGDGRGWVGAAKDPGWYFGRFPASETGILPPEELSAARRDMSEDEYLQEYETSFEASIKGSIYGAELRNARAEGRIGVVPMDPVLPVDTSWDLGIGDATAIWFSQSVRGGSVRLVDYYECSGEGLPHYAQVLRTKGYVYGRHIAPHDVLVRELGSGRSRLEAAQGLGITFEVAPSLGLEDGIHAVRMLFPRCWFDEGKCQSGLEALMNYRRDWNSRVGEFKATPVHDFSEHGCLVAGTRVTTRRGDIPIEDVCVGDEAWTPRGWARVTAAGPSAYAEELVTIETARGRLVCTPDHGLFTTRGVVPAGELRATDQLFGGREWTLRLVSLLSMAIGSGFRATITGESRGRVSGPRICSAPSGKRRMDRFRQRITFTIGMAIRATMPWRISPVFLAVSTSGLTLRRWWPLAFSNHPMRWPMSDRGRFTRRQPDARSISDSVSSPVSRGRRGRGWNAAVSNVVSRFVRHFLRVPSGAISIARWNTSVCSEARPLVYDLTVDDHACYRANGLLVSNSSAFRYLAVSQKEPVTKKPSDQRRYRQESEYGWLA